MVKQSALKSKVLQILSNLANDYGDGVRGTDNEDRVGPQRAIQSGQITPEQMFEAIKKNILVVIALTISLVYVAFGHQNLLYALLIIVLGLYMPAYSVTSCKEQGRLLIASKP